jgi:hypothetical protein
MVFSDLFRGIIRVTKGMETYRQASINFLLIYPQKSPKNINSFLGLFSD